MSCVQTNTMEFTLYSKDGCRDCVVAQVLLEDAKQPFICHKVHKDESREVLVSHRASKYPIVYCNKQFVGSLKELKSVFEEYKIVCEEDF